MKKNISWWTLLILGFFGHMVGYIFGGVIGSAIGVLGDILFLIGLVNGIALAFKKESHNTDLGNSSA